MNHKFTVVLGSHSKIKLLAIQKIYPHANIVCLPNFQSSIPEQPVGIDETVIGAVYRKDKAKEFDKTADIWIGIESGIINKNNEWFDRSYISIETKNGIDFICWSEDLQIPMSIQEILNIIKHKKTWSLLKDPHSVLTNNKKSRNDFIVDAIIKYIEYIV
jgi:non-canonical (house-cleaning) NTP pyrophosphatase